jgi:hypothetical protein
MHIISTHGGWLKGLYLKIELETKGSPPRIVFALSWTIGHTLVGTQRFSGQVDEVGKIRTFFVMRWLKDKSSCM